MYDRRKRRKSLAINLALIGSIAVLIGFKSWLDVGASSSWSTTQPSGGHGFFRWFGGGHSSGGSSIGGGTHRGGFGGSGHSVGS